MTRGFKRPLAGLAVLGACLATAPASAMTYSLVTLESPRCGARCPTVVSAQGMIEKDEDSLFGAFATAQSGGVVPRTLLIGSLGGYGVGGVKLGYVLRQLKFNVIVGQPGVDDGGHSGVGPAVCASACVFVLAGGVRRSVASGGVVGVHRPYVSGQVRDVVGNGTIDPDLDYVGLERALAAFFKLMGVSPALSGLSMNTPSNSVHMLSARELRFYKVVTGRG